MGPLTGNVNWPVEAEMLIGLLTGNVDWPIDGGRQQAK